MFVCVRVGVTVSLMHKWKVSAKAYGGVGREELGRIGVVGLICFVLLQPVGQMLI